MSFESAWILFCVPHLSIVSFLFFNDTATTEIYTYLHTLSLHDALPISSPKLRGWPTSLAPSLSPELSQKQPVFNDCFTCKCVLWIHFRRSEEHTSELQSLMRISYAVFCLKKKKYTSKLKTTQITNHRKR